MTDPTGQRVSETFWCMHCGKQIYRVPDEIAQRPKPLYASTPMYQGEDAPITCRHANYHAPREPNTAIAKTTGG
jgi:hypothetical protein